MNGSYTVCQNIVFDDGASLLLPFTRIGGIFPNYINEKTAVEVEAIALTQKQMTIPRSANPRVASC